MTDREMEAERLLRWAEDVIPEDCDHLDCAHSGCSLGFLRTVRAFLAAPARADPWKQRERCLCGCAGNAAPAEPQEERPKKGRTKKDMAKDMVASAKRYAVEPQEERYTVQQLEAALHAANEATDDVLGPDMFTVGWWDLVDAALKKTAHPRAETEGGE